MHLFMAASVDGVSRLDLVRHGGAELILEAIYGGVRKDSFVVKQDDKSKIADWLGFDSAELAVIAKKTGLALFEAIASARRENGMALDRLKAFYNLAQGAPAHGPFAERTMASMCGSNALLELFDISLILAMKGLREDNPSNFGDRETVYSRLPAN
jgi:hypothetical protein